MYQAIYKCRLCGEEFCKRTYEKRYDAELLITILSDCETTHTHTTPRYPFRRIEKHNCKDGSFGFADFQGFKKSEVSTHD